MSQDKEELVTLQLTPDEVCELAIVVRNDNPRLFRKLREVLRDYEEEQCATT